MNPPKAELAAYKPLLPVLKTRRYWEHNTSMYIAQINIMPQPDPNSISKSGTRLKLLNRSRVNIG